MFNEIIKTVFMPKLALGIDPLTAVALLTSLGGGIYSGMQQDKQNKRLSQISQVNPADLPGHLGSTEPGRLLLESLQRSPQGIPSDIMKNAMNLLTSREGDLKHNARSTVGSLGGATGTTGSSLLTDQLLRAERDVDQQIGGERTDLLMKDALAKLEDQRFLENLRLSGTELDASMAKAKAIGQGQGAFTPPPQPLTSPTATGLLTGGNIAQGFGDLQDILSTVGTKPEPAETPQDKAKVYTPLQRTFLSTGKPNKTFNPAFNLLNFKGGSRGGFNF